MLLVDLLLKYSKNEADRFDGNCSVYALAGIPMLFSALRALLIEANSGMYGTKPDQASLERLAKDQNEISLLVEKYKIDSNTEQNLKWLYEIRNEIIHPAHMPSGTADNTPEYLHPIKKLGLLQSTRIDDSDFVWISQLQSHKLFSWGASVIAEAATKVLDLHILDKETHDGFLSSYLSYKQFCP